MENRQSKLLQLIDSKLTKAKTAKEAKTGPGQHRADAVKPRRSSVVGKRMETNRQNAQKSTGPKSAEGKAKAAANSLKHGFFANVDKLHPQDAPAYQSTLADLRMGLQPDGPVEEQLIRELAMFTTRLQRLEAAEYALLAGNIEGDPPELTGESVVSDQQIDAREIAAAFQKCAADLEALHKIEVHLRRAYNRTWDRLEKIQKERHKLSLDESLKRSQIWLTYYAEKENLTNKVERTGPDETTSNPSSVVRDQETAVHGQSRSFQNEDQKNIAGERT